MNTGMNTENRDELQRLVGSNYQLQWVIGHGGMSTVWLADDVAGEREVAIKVLRPEFSSNEEFLTRFRNEALAAEGINSPNVVATYDYREVQTPAGFTMCFIVMEYIRGESLADLIAREGQLDEALALDVLEQAAHGLAVIHRMGLVHRDIKPGNLMLTQNGQVKITDFGIAKAAAAVPLTRTGMVVGTAQYVSPEQAQGFTVTPASDIYSLSVVGYEMLSGTRPFTGDSSVSVALAHVNNEPPPLPITVTAPARELIEIGLRKDPGQAPRRQRDAARRATGARGHAPRAAGRPHAGDRGRAVPDRVDANACRRHREPHLPAHRRLPAFGGPGHRGETPAPAGAGWAGGRRQAKALEGVADRRRPPGAGPARRRRGVGVVQRRVRRAAQTRGAHADARADAAHGHADRDRVRGAGN